MSCFPFFTDYKLISSNYLDEDLMTPALSNYLLLLMKYVSFDDGLEVTGVFLNVSKAFDKVMAWKITSRTKWYISKSFKLLRWFSILSQTTSSSKWKTFILGDCYNAGVLQGSFLESLLFSIYINNLSNGVFKL